MIARLTTTCTHGVHVITGNKVLMGMWLLLEISQTLFRLSDLNNLGNVQLQTAYKIVSWMEGQVGLGRQSVQLSFSFKERNLALFPLSP